MIAPSVAARLAVHVDYAMAMRLAQPKNPTPPLDPQLAADWELVAHVVGYDRVIRAGQGNDPDAGVCYGVLLRSRTGDHMQLLIRGTNGLVGWLEDVEFAQTDADGPGRVHHGFWGIYKSFQLVGPDGRQIGLTFISGLAQLVGDRNLTVAGHSLGAPLATYIVDALLDLSIVPTFAAFCSPRPGDQSFANVFENKMVGHFGTYTVFNYEADLVPTLPPRVLGFAPLRRLQLVTHAAALTEIRSDLECNHHALSMALMLDPSAVDPAADYGCVVGARK